MNKVINTKSVKITFIQTGLINNGAGQQEIFNTIIKACYEKGNITFQQIQP